MKVILTFKSGKFYFSSEYDPSRIDNLLVRAEVLNETIADLPILPDLASRIEPDLMYSSIAGTAAIEGNPITDEGVRKIAAGEDPAEYTQKHKQEIKNLIAAYGLLSGVAPKHEPFLVTEELIGSIHAMITRDVPVNDNIPGQYRNGKVLVGDKGHGGVYTPPEILEDVKNLMRELIAWINDEETLSLNPLLRASLLHYHFCLIHPFWGGNGRTARLLEAIVLQSAGIRYVPRELSNYYYRNVDDYYSSFSRGIALKKDPTPFLAFCLEAAIASLTRIRQSIVGYIRLFTLGDFYRFNRKQKMITARQYDLLAMLLENPVPFTLKDLYGRRPFSLLYGKVSTQTARRDIKKLVEQHYLLADGEDAFSLNLRVLG